MNGRGGIPPRIVVVGASAGGLEPLERLFSSLPVDTGCVFVVVQHLSPDFRSVMDQLLSRHTTMPIGRLEDGSSLEPDRVYLNLPRTLVTLEDERVRLRPAGTSDNHPIDALLESLAERHAGRVLAVLLSGTGSDGRRGCERLRASGGQVIVQSPSEARFDGMPRAVIDAGHADAIVPVAAMAGRIALWTRGGSLREARGGDSPDGDPFADILALVRHRYGTDFARYRGTTVSRRVRRRADLAGKAELGHYAELLRRDDEELDELYGDLLIEVTAFFRDAEAFECVAREAVPALVARLAEGRSLRLWVAGCASGEEAYSLAVLLAEGAAAAELELDARIFATDVHGRSLERAAAGSYPASSVQHLDDARVDAWFEREGNRVRVRDELRRLVTFDTHDVMRDGPFTRIDFLSCRNLLIYLNPEAQSHVLSRFHAGLAEGGWLFLGPSENVAGLEHAFETRDRRWRLFRRRGVAPPAGPAMPTTVRPSGIAPGGTARATGRLPGDGPARATSAEAPRERGGDADPSPGSDDVRFLRARVRDLEAGLRASEQNLQTTIEELRTTNEELQSTNEELSSSNEELQSTNEELHSVNEELYAVSAEHRRKIEELSTLTSDVDHLLRSSEIGTLFLDRELRLRRYSERAGELFGLRSRDVGRPIDDIGSRLPAAVAARAHEVRRSRAPIETDLELDERRYLLRVLPHLDVDGEIDGVLMSSVDVTELSETRRELRRIDREYRTIVEDTASFIVRWRASDGRITYCNEIYAEFFDATPDALVGRELAALIPEPERAGFVERIATIEPGESRFIAVVRDDPDGGATYTVGFTRAIADEDGTIVEYQSTGQDLSEEYAYRRALEQLVATTKDPALDHAERLQRILGLCLDYLELRSGFVSRIDGEEYHVIAVAGDAAGRYAAGDVLALGETVCANLPGDGALLAIEHLAESALRDHPCHAATGIESFVAARLATAEGNYGSISFSSPQPRERPFTVAEESFVMLVSSWIGYMIDSRRQLERIARSNDYYQSLYLGLPVVMCLTDPEGTVVEVSDEWLEHLDRGRADTLGEPFVDVLSAEHRDVAAEAIRHGTVDDLSLCVHRADGEVVEHEMSCRTRSIGTLEDMRLIVLADVSARNRAIEEARSRNRELADANDNLNQFAFVASHDLQEPLRKIQQFSGFLVEDEGDALSEDGRYHLKVIVEAAERMSRLIRGLLQYSRASRNALERERVPLDAVLAQARADLDLPLTESGARLAVDPLPVVSGDPVLLLQLFTNLLANAVKYREPSRALEIEVRHESGRDGRESRIDVIDNGIGFDPDYRTKVFEPFVRLHGEKDYRGSGIGLAICATVCRKHGWRIEADGRAGRGARFSVIIDASDEDDREGRAA